MKFKQKFTEDQRIGEGSRITSRYPDRVPIILERADNENTIPVVDKSKYLVPRDLTVGQFIYVIRKRINIKPDKALFIS